jgi:hypothetical protein
LFSFDGFIMAAVSALTLASPIVPMVSTFSYDDLDKVKVKNSWTTGQAPNQEDHEYTMYLPTTTDPNNTELLLYVVDQFLDGAHNDRLHISTGAGKYNKFRLVIGGDLRVQFAALSAARANKTNDSFLEDVSTLISRYNGATAAEDQKEYMRNFTKPYSVSCEVLGTRLRVVSSLCKYLPGANGVELFVTDDEKKRAYYMMMPNAWRVQFIATGNVLDGAYDYFDLVRFMSVQESLSKRTDRRNQLGKRKPSSGGGQGGYGRGSYGGRGGRGGYGRGRGGRGNYQYHQGYGAGGHSGGGRGFGASYANTPNPYLTPRSPAGRFTSPATGRGRFGSGGGRFATPGTGRGYSLRPSYARGGGRPPLPSVPTFYTEDQFYQDASEHYEYPQGSIPDGYFTHMEQVPSQQEHYYSGDPHVGQQQQEFNGNDGREEHKEDSHWLEY